MLITLPEANVRVEEPELAAKLARLSELRNWSFEEALRSILHTGVDREIEIAEKLKCLHEIQDRIAALPDLAPGFTDKDLYDKDGLPVL